MVILSIWNANQGKFPQLLLPLTCQNMSLFSPNKALLEQTDYPSMGCLKIVIKVNAASTSCHNHCCFWRMSAQGDILTVATQLTLWAMMFLLWSALPRWGESKSVFGVVFSLFFLAGSIAMLHWLPVTQGSDQYWVSGAVEQAARGLDSDYAP